MRAPGVLCCAYFMEHIFHEAARKMNLNQLQLRTDNLIEAGFVDMFGRTEIGNRVKTNFNQIISEVDLPKQIQQVDQFNRENEYRKQGWSVTPFKYRWSNEITTGGIRIVIGRFDGSVWVSNYGTEMGQGQHTRVAQVIAGKGLSQIFL